MIVFYMLAAAACLDALFFTMGLLEKKVDNVNYFAAVWAPFVLFATAAAAGWSEGIANALDAYVLKTVRHLAPQLTSQGEAVFFATFMLMVMSAPLFYTAGVRAVEYAQARAAEKVKAESEARRWARFRLEQLRQIKHVLMHVSGKTETEILLAEILERLESIEKKLEAAPAPAFKLPPAPSGNGRKPRREEEECLILGGRW